MLASVLLCFSSMVIDITTPQTELLLHWRVWCEMRKTNAISNVVNLLDKTKYVCRYNNQIIESLLKFDFLYYYKNCFWVAPVAVKSPTLTCTTVSEGIICFSTFKWRNFHVLWGRSVVCSPVVFVWKWFSRHWLNIIIFSKVWIRTEQLVRSFYKNSCSIQGEEKYR